MKRKSLAGRLSGKRVKPFLCDKTQSDEKISLIEKDKESQYFYKHQSL